MRTKLWKRLLSLVLALAMMAPMVLDLIPEVGQTVNAAYADAGTLSAGKEGQLVNGIYEIRVKNSNLALGYDTTEHATKGADTLVRLKPADGTDTQRWIVEYAGSDGGTLHYYNIRNVGNGRMLRMENNHCKFGYDTGVKAHDTAYWRLVYNDVDNTYLIHSWYVYMNKTVNGGYAYMTPVTAAHSGVKSETDGAPLQALGPYYGFEFRRVMVQNYGAYELEGGTYRVEGDGTRDGVVDSYLTALPNAVPEPLDPDDPNANWNYTCGLTYKPNSSAVTDGTQTFVFDQTSQGYVTFFDAKTGRYIGDRSGKSVAFAGAIADIKDRDSTDFDDRLRFYWVPVPDYSGITRLDRYYLCNVLTGKCLYLAADAVEGDVVKTDLLSRSSWKFTARSDTDIYKENENQGYNGTTDVYLDSIDQSNTIKLPIKIYDYVNDGMLFEYAQYVGTSQTQTAGGKFFRLGNNRAYAFQAGSNGGSWSGISSGYYAGKNEADAWNTYKTFTLGKVWAKFSKDSYWYTQDGSPVGSYNGSTFNSNRYEYNWEAYGLAGFRGQTTAMDPDSASIYFMYGYSDVTPQGVGSGKPTYNANGVLTNSFTTKLWQSDRMSSYTGVLVPRAAEAASAYQYSLYGYLTGYATFGLVQAELNTITKPDGRVYRVPEYRDTVVEYLADLLKKSLAVPETKVVNGTTEYAYNRVAGAVHERYGNQRDFAAWLRGRCNINNAILQNDMSLIKVGDYDTTYAKRDQLIGTWDECKDNIQNLCDAAYFMLNNLFVSGSYNEEQEMFNYLELNGVKVDDSDGDIVDAYVFDSGFTTGGTTATGSSSAVYYDTVEKTIRNTSVTGKASAFIDNGTPVCAHPFLPIWNNDFDMATQTGTQNGTKSPYVLDDGVTGGINDTATYANRNYNYVIASNGEFQYSYDDELFFNFEGDDDVYLFINGQLVLDIGGAHAITGFKINLNDYVNAAKAAIANGTATARDYALNLQDGGIYSFDFYYMERHGWGSNMRIVTNIRVVEKGMLVDKDGAQFGADLDTNDIVDPDAPVEYFFGLTNSGTEDLIWPTFVDNNIGVTISYNNGLTVTAPTNGATVMDKNGDTLDVTDLVISYTNPKTGNTSKRTFSSQEALIHYLTHELVIETHEKATPPFGKVTIGGIYYKLTEEQQKQGVFRNTVDVTAHVRNSTTSRKPINAIVANSSVNGLDTVITGDSANGPVNGSITMTNTLDTERTWPYINYHGQVNINPDVGLYLPDGSYAVDSNGERLEVSDLIFTYTDPDGNVTVHQFSDNEELKEYLKTLVIEPDGTLTVDGVYFAPTGDGESTVNQSVVISTIERDTADSIPSSNATTGIELKDSADFTVFVPNEPKYYHWRDHEMVISHAILTEDIKELVQDPNNPLSTIFRPVIQTVTSVAVADEDGNPLQSDEIWVEGQNVHVKFQTTGSKLVYLNVGYTYYNNSTTKQATATIPVQIFVVDTPSYVYVLDYGLRVELTRDQLFSEDVVTVPKRDTKHEMLGIDGERHNVYYGNNNVNNFTAFVDGTGAFAWGFNAYESADGTIDVDGNFEVRPDATGDQIYLTYTPRDFMEGRDHIYIAMRVSEKDYDTAGDNFNITDIRNEAEMFKTVTFLPANVVYYEDDFPAANVPAGSFTSTSEHGQAQSSDQNQQYGYDDVYADSADVTMSGGTFATVTIGARDENGDVVNTGASFTFKGTGFEFISRANAASSATVEVKVTDSAGNVSYYPVITKFDQQINGAGGNEQVYQVPVFRLEGLEYGEYEVVIKGIPKIIGILKDENGNYVRDENGRFVYEYQTSYLYVDGIRIYNPLGTGPVAEYGDESQAQFHELRDLVFSDKSAIIRLTTDETGAPVLSGTFGQHYSFTENLYAGTDRKWFETSVGGLDQFIIAGPNNEVYLDGTSDVYAAVLYVKESTAGQKGLLNIGVHDIHDSDYYTYGTTNETSSITYWLADEKWASPIEIGHSGTEQYYAIDYRNCPVVELAGESYYSVAIQVRSGMVSFTNVKTVGLEFAPLGTLAQDIHYQYDENGVLCQGKKDADGHITDLVPVSHTFIDVDNETQQVYNTVMVNLFSLRRALMSTRTEEDPEIVIPPLPTPDPEPEDPDVPPTVPGDDGSEEIPETGDVSLFEYLAEALTGILFGN